MRQLVLEIDQVSKSYGDKQVLHEVSFELKRGQILGLLGRNGAGKSTLISCIVGLHAPDSGSISVLGLPVSDGYPHIGYVPQELAIYPTLTVRENLRFFAELKCGSWRDNERAITDTMDRVGLAPLESRIAGNLSLGERRRLHTAVGLLGDPSLILMDEPTAGADFETRERLLSMLRELSETTAVIYTTHYAAEVDAIATDVAVLERGRLLKMVSMADLTEHAPPASVTFEVRSLAGLPEVRRYPVAAPDEQIPTLIAQLHADGYEIDRLDVGRVSAESLFLKLVGSTAKEPSEEAV